MSGKGLEVLTWLQSDHAGAALAGALGGLVRWVTLRESVREGLGSLLVGSVCALYLGPLVEPVLTPVLGKLAPGAGASGFASFVVGLGGIGFSGLILDILRNMRRRYVPAAETPEAPAEDLAAPHVIRPNDE